MNISASIELPDEVELSGHCLDIRELGKKIEFAIFRTIYTNTRASEQPTVRVTFGETAMICGSCAAPLLPSGACSSRNCDFGRISQRKPSAKSLTARVPGVRLASTLKKA